MYLKAVLLLFVGLLAGGILLMENPSLRTAALLIVAIWGCCRAYYFAFYVIQHYIDPKFRFAGLMSVLRYFMEKKRSSGDEG